jgi:hypothetical protein
MTQDSEPVQGNAEEINLRREKVAEQLVKGLNGPEISEKLGIPYGTVKDDIRIICTEWKDFARIKPTRPFQMAYIELEQLRRKLWEDFNNLGNTKADHVLSLSYARNLLKVMHEMNELVGLYDSSAFEVKPEKQNSAPGSIPMKSFKDWLRNLDPELRHAIFEKLGDLFKRVDSIQGEDVESSTEVSDKQTDDDSASERRKDDVSDS